MLAIYVIWTENFVKTHDWTGRFYEYGC